MSGRVNREYLRLWKEVCLFALLAARSRHRAAQSSRILIVNTCLIGEFCASLHAIRDFIERHPSATIDMAVSAPLVPVAERIRGVHAAFPVPSVYDRESERTSVERFGSYDHIIALRISPIAYRLIRNAGARAVTTGLSTFLRYGAHLAASLWRRTVPKQWWETNFDMLGGQPRLRAFDEIFGVDPEELARVARRLGLAGPEPSVLIHVGSRWPMKEWGDERWVALLRELHSQEPYRFVCIGTPAEDQHHYEEMAARVPFTLSSLIGKTTLWELLLAMRASTAFVGIDSGPANMAHLAGLRSITIYGPGPHIYLPVDPRDIAIDNSGGRGLFQMFVSIRDCYIRSIAVDQVISAFERLVRDDTAAKEAG